MPSRFAYQAGMVDQLDSLATSGELPDGIVVVGCPVCRCSVYVPSDSDRELVECAWCEKQLWTRASLSGVRVVELDERQLIADFTPPTETLQLASEP